MENPSRKNEFFGGMKDTIPMVVGAIPFGIIFGALGVTGGIPPLTVMGLSLFVFAGSAQFIAVGLITQGVAIGIIILTTFVVNMRHALYSASLAPYTKHLSQKWLIPLGFWLTDESYAVVIRHYQKEDLSPHKHWYYLGSCILMYVNWQICTIIGIVAGNQFEDASQLGLDFAMAVTFIGIVVPLIINRPMLISAITAGVVGILANGLPNKLGLMIAAVCGIAVGYFAETWQEKQKENIPLPHDISVEVLHE